MDSELSVNGNLVLPGGGVTVIGAGASLTVAGTTDLRGSALVVELPGGREGDEVEVISSSSLQGEVGLVTVVTDECNATGTAEQELGKLIVLVGSCGSGLTRNQVIGVVAGCIGAALLLVGLPLNMDDSESEMSIRARAFAKRVGRRFRIPTEMVDERLTSFAARETGSDRPHEAAATMIAESWLAAGN